MTRNVVGALGTSARASVDARGAVSLGDLTLDWWIGADDRWHIPAEEPGVRQRRVGAAPVYETRVRIPSGDAVHRVYATSDAFVIEVENDSPAPFSLGLVVGVGRGDAALADRVLDLGDRRVTLSQAPRFWAAGASTREVVTSGAAASAGETTWRAPGEVTMLVPVAHRTRLRAVVGERSVAEVPDADAVVRAWDRHLDRGLRTELPDPTQARVDAVRADLLLAEPDTRVTGLLEDWGLERGPEFDGVWSALGRLGRRAALRRADVAEPWLAAQRAADDVDWLRAMRAVLVREARDHVEVLPGFPDEWRGANLGVHDIPLRSGGALSYALRWHGDRPALLWDAPAGVQLRAPVLAPEWRAEGGAGEAMVS